MDEKKQLKFWTDSYVNGSALYDENPEAKTEIDNLNKVINSNKLDFLHEDIINFNKIIFKMVLYFDPSKFFLWPGFILALVGIVYGAYQVLTTAPRNLGQFPIMVFLAGLQIAFLGLIAELIVKSRRK